MSLRSCLVSCRDPQETEHVVEVTAESLYEAVTLGLHIFHENAWVEEIGRGLTAIKVVVKQPEVQHTVLIKDFERWLASAGNTAAEVTLKNRLKTILHWSLASARTSRMCRRSLPRVVSQSIPRAHDNS